MLVLPGCCLIASPDTLADSLGFATSVIGVALFSVLEDTESEGVTGWNPENSLKAVVDVLLSALLVVASVSIGVSEVVAVQSADVDGASVESIGISEIERLSASIMDDSQLTVIHKKRIKCG